MNTYINLRVNKNEQEVILIFAILQCIMRKVYLTTSAIHFQQGEEKNHFIFISKENDLLKKMSNPFPNHLMLEEGEITPVNRKKNNLNLSLSIFAEIKHLSTTQKFCRGILLICN